MPFGQNWLQKRLADWARKQNRFPRSGVGIYFLLRVIPGEAARLLLVPHMVFSQNEIISFKLREKVVLPRHSWLICSRRDTLSKQYVAVDCSLNLHSASCWWCTPRLINNASQVHFSGAPAFLFKRTLSAKTGLARWMEHRPAD